MGFLVTPGFPWVAMQWGIWRAGGIAVPLPLNSPRPELEYLVDDTGASALVFDTGADALLEPIAAARGLRAFRYDQLPIYPLASLPEISSERRAMILYTSGTTSRPKGVVTTHFNVAAQIKSLVEAWEWSVNDRILLCLPLHHVHGIINVVGCALWSGATCDMLPRFEANAVWDRIAAGQLTLFMAVPTVYTKLIAAWDAASPERQEELSQACRRLRLMVSGSAALPVSTLARWQEISGHTLLGALRDDRDWHGTLEPIARGACAGECRSAATWRRAAASRREWQSSSPGYTRRDRSPRSSGLHGVLGQTRRDTGCLSRWLVYHWRHRGCRERYLPHPWSNEHRHTQDWWPQSIRSGDRRSAAPASRDCRVCE